MSCEALDYLPARATLNAQSTSHGPRPGPALSPWCTSDPPSCPPAESARQDPRKAEKRSPMCKNSVLWRSFLFRPRVLPRAPGCEARRGGCVYTTAKVWVSAGIRGACSGRSKSRILVSNHGIDFRRARANQVHGTPPKCFVSVLFFALCCLCTIISATRGTIPPLKRCIL